MIAPQTTYPAATANWIQRCTDPVGWLFHLSPREATFQTRGIVGHNPARQLALEGIGQTFIAGYNAALTANNVREILQYVAAAPVASRGFAVEGAAMGVAIAGVFPHRRTWLNEYIKALEKEFTYLVHVGIGWALARIPWSRRRLLGNLDPIHRWLAFDGLGFHDTYFYHPHVLGGWRRQPSGYAARAYDQGVGRAIWFIAAGCPDHAIHLISTFPDGRQSDQWSGLGLAMAYAGPVANGEIVEALKSTGSNEGCFAQGVAFACEAHVRANYIPRHSEEAAQTIWGIDAVSLAHIVRQARARLPNIDGHPPRYELWRQEVNAAFSYLRWRRR